MQKLLTTGRGAGGVPGSISFADYGGGQADNALRANRQLGLRPGEVNPYYPNGNVSSGNLSSGGQVQQNRMARALAGGRQRYNPGFSAPPSTNMPGQQQPFTYGDRHNPLANSNHPSGRYATGRGTGGFNQVGNQPQPEPTGPYPQSGGPVTIDNATGQPIGGNPAWMNTPDGQRYMAAVVAADPLAAQAANPNGFNQAAFGLDAGGNAPPTTGLIGSEQALMEALGGATNTLNTGMATADNFLAGSANAYNPYIESGLNTFGLQADLSGANGQGAFDAAFNESPVQAFLREQGERSVTQNAAALGGLGGGNVMKELTRFGQGNASQGLQQQIDNLSNITNLGFDATGNQANINNARGNMAYQNAGTIAQGIGSAGQRIAGDRLQIGRDMSASIGGTTSALANLVNQQGAGLSDMTGAGGSNLAKLFESYGMNEGQSAQALSAVLANILSGQGSNVAGLSGIPGVQQTDGIMDDVAAVAEGVGTAMASDRRLKTNIIKVGETAGGANIYKWEWNEEGEKIAGNQVAFGVMADEVDPDIVTTAPDGYKRVDYSRVV